MMGIYQLVIADRPDKNSIVCVDEEVMLRAVVLSRFKKKHKYYFKCFTAKGYYCGEVVKLPSDLLQIVTDFSYLITACAKSAHTYETKFNRPCIEFHDLFTSKNRPAIDEVDITSEGFDTMLKFYSR